MVAILINVAMNNNEHLFVPSNCLSTADTRRELCLLVWVASMYTIVIAICIFAYQSMRTQRGRLAFARFRQRLFGGADSLRQRFDLGE